MIDIVAYAAAAGSNDFASVWFEVFRTCSTDESLRRGKKAW